jgi:hypothetical protein
VYGEGRQGHPGQSFVIEYLPVTHMQNQMFCCSEGKSASNASLHVQENTSKEKCTNPECTSSLHFGTAMLLDLVQVFYAFAD